MVAKFIFAISLCFSVFIMPHFWQHGTHYLECMSTFDAQTDSIFKENNQKIADDINLTVRVSPKASLWKAKNDRSSIYLDTLLTLLNQKIAKINLHQSLSEVEIDSIVAAEQHFNLQIMRLIDVPERKDFNTKLSTSFIQAISPNSAVALQKIWLQSQKDRASRDAIVLGSYFRDKWSYCGYIDDSDIRVQFYTKNFTKNECKGEIILADNTRNNEKDSVWVNGVLGDFYKFTPRKPGYHYFCVKANITDENGAPITLRDTFRLLVGK